MKVYKENVFLAAQIQGTGMLLSAPCLIIDWQATLMLWALTFVIISIALLMEIFLRK